jgi:DNA-binding CsgD family transcriptional regulator
VNERNKRDDGLPLPEGTWVELLEPDLALLAIPVAEPSVPAPLAAAERDIVLAVYEGATNEEIAQRRGVSAKTVANQLESIYRKLSVTSRAELVLLLRGVRSP